MEDREHSKSGCVAECFLATGFTPEDLGSMLTDCKGSLELEIPEAVLVHHCGGLPKEGVADLFSFVL